MKINSLNKPCPCGSGKKYKRCCLLTGKTYYKNGIANWNFNIHFNRYESKTDHKYGQFIYKSCKYIDAVPYNGRLKCRLVHMEGKSIIIPDYIFLKNNGWIQPLFFSPPYIAKLEDNYYLCDFFVDIQNGENIKVRFYSDALITQHSDKSQLYYCEIYGPEDIEEYSCGEYIEEGNNLLLKLYHHTDDKGFDGIIESNSIWTSKWNYRGSKECVNYNFAYFTHIPEIKFASDLNTVAMSADGKIDYVIDSFVQPKIEPADFREVYKDFLYTAKVYRATTEDRSCTIGFYVPVEAIDIKHIYSHYQSGRYFYEICFTYIHRIKTKAKSVITFDKEFVIENKEPIVNSDYSIIGDAQTKEGLAAPLEEEETKFIFKIEDCGNQSIHDFWFSHSNKDLFTDKKIVPVDMREVLDNPTK